MIYRRMFAVGIGAILLSACASAIRGNAVPESATPTSQARIPAGVDPFASAEAPASVDPQGAIVVEVQPAIVDELAQQIVFEVSLNTHSVDLGMDLAPLSTLQTDTGLTVPAAAWDAPRGGHHVSGQLRFPSRLGGASVLEGARHLTLTIRDLDTPSRLFEWDLP